LSMQKPSRSSTSLHQPVYASNMLMRKQFIILENKK
jgi:hypothetical protein